ncbi:putative serine protease do-like precursor [Bradyrhizobium sp. ORS 375]|uniref:Do family serine endopeptidase n=1 Tax=Bradyrhizobium sp. (strain ORS 375) TaxID=566679 RepID=UPI0002407AE8|nr:Do family serine endopeptidase [Bradyrhizobium sp. ORS 375]CCD95738.1 putative serine protease do-like precursor [Bradyrhizobium sp. ORS 375]
MSDSCQQPRRRIWAARRLTLLGSVAVIGSVLALSGPLGYGRLIDQAWAAGPVQAQQGPTGFADLVAKVRPAVISVRVSVDEADETAAAPGPNGEPAMPGSPFEKFFRQYGDEGAQGEMPRHRLMTGVGSGFFISADGYAVTNNHVVDHARSVQVTTDDGKTYTAKVIGTDPKTDVALIKVEGNSDFAYVNLDSRTPRVGDWVVAVGNPYGLGGTVTAGIVSAEGRELSSNPYDNYIQIDAPINKGNSGGPTFDTNGNVIGINTAIYSPSGGSVGIGFDIPAPTVKMIVAQLKDKGVVTRGWLGVQVQPVTAGIAESLGMKTAAGALVDEAKPDTPAAKAGIQPGDIITAVDGDAVKNSRALASQIAAMAPGSEAKLDILRKGEAKTITVTLANMPNQPEKQARVDDHDNAPTRGVPHLGLSVAPADDVAGAGSNGLVVTSVDPDGPAAEHGVQSGDVILDVGGKSVGNAADLRNALSAARSAGKRDVLMRLRSADNTRFVAVPVG